MKKTVGYSFTVEYQNHQDALKTPVKIARAETTVPASREFVSLWDTGATCSVITPDVVKQLGLIPVSFEDVATPQGCYVAPVYYISLLLPNNAVFPKLHVIAGTPAGCDILIGMDVIGQGDFAVSNLDNKTTFTFRIPSLTKLDFVKHSYFQPSMRDEPKHPSKNSKCPCGSGLKYRQCCGKALFNKKD